MSAKRDAEPLVLPRPFRHCIGHRCLANYTQQCGKCLCHYEASSRHGCPVCEATVVRPAWETRADYRGRKVDVVTVGPFRLVARSDSYTLVLSTPFARNRPDARKGAIDAARKLLSEWAAELDALEHQERAVAKPGER